jgi:L-fuculose-phosphate aldolase
MTSRRCRNRVLAVVRAMVARGLVVGTTGNVSMRARDRVYITPTRLDYDAMTRRDVVAVELAGRPMRSRHGPSSELPLHLALYDRRPDVGGIVHTHSRAAVTWSMIASGLPPMTEDARYYRMGAVPVVPQTTPCAEPAALIAALGDGRAILLEGHGVVAVGEGPYEALWIACAVEHMAAVALSLRALRDGGGHCARRPAIVGTWCGLP